MVYHDQHVHCHYSGDSDESIAKYLEVCHKAGCRYIAFTDHVDRDFMHRTDVCFVYSEDERDAEVYELIKQYPDITYLKGVEIGYRRDNYDFIKDRIASHDYDVVNMSLHETGVIDFYRYEYFTKYGIDNVLNTCFDCLLEIAELDLEYNVFTHFDYGFKTAYLRDNSLRISKYEDKLKKVMQALIERGRVLEVNAKVQSVLPEEHTRYFLRLYKSLGGTELTLSSDAHTIDKYRLGFDKYMQIIKQEGFDHLVYFVKKQPHRFEL